MIAAMTSTFAYFITIIFLMVACSALMINVVGNLDRRSPLKNTMMTLLFAVSVAASLSIAMGLLHYMKNGF